MQVEDLDVASLSSIRSFAARWGNRPLHVLVNNAGLFNICGASTQCITACAQTHASMALACALTVHLRAHAALAALGCPDFQSKSLLRWRRAHYDCACLKQVIPGDHSGLAVTWEHHEMLPQDIA